MVSHFECSKQHNLRRFSFGAIAKVFLRAGTATLMLNVKKFMCVQFDFKDRRQDRTEYQQNTMECPCTSDPTEYKYAFRHLKGTDNFQLKSF